MTQTHVRAGIAALALLAVAERPASAKGLTIAENGDQAITLGMWSHALYTFQHVPADDTSSIRIRHARLALRGKINARTGFFLQVEGAGEPALLDAVGTFTVSPWFAIKAGQHKTPLLYESISIPTERLLAETSIVNQRLIGGLIRDTGVMVFGGPKEGIFAYQLGVYGGNGFNHTPSDNVPMVIGRVEVKPVAPVTLAANASYSKHAAMDFADLYKFVYADEEARRDTHVTRAGVEGHVRRGPLQVDVETLFARFDAEGARLAGGGLAQGAYFVIPRIQLTGRVDGFDPDLEQSDDAVLQTTGGVSAVLAPDDGAILRVNYSTQFPESGDVMHKVLALLQVEI